MSTREDYFDVDGLRVGPNMWRGKLDEIAALRAQLAAQRAVIEAARRWDKSDDPADSNALQSAVAEYEAALRTPELKK